MTRKVFYSFHYKPDNWRVAQVRNIGSIEDNKPASDNDWQEVANKGDSSIKNWIDGQMLGRSCTVVLAGRETAGRKWINYEIEQSWDNGMGIAIIHIHNLKDRLENQSFIGENPLNYVRKEISNTSVRYIPPYTDSRQVYAWIKENLPAIIEEAISLRKNSKY